MHSEPLLIFDIIHEKPSKLRQNKALSLQAYLREKECILTESHSIQILSLNPKIKFKTDDESIKHLLD